MDDALISVGIDVGTATTKVVISRLRFANRSLSPGVPRVRLVSREVLWRSQVQSTPVVGNRLQGEQLLALVNSAYAQAGVQPADVQSGGVIITGEAARKENAQALLHLLARAAGDFVVATAGPHLEAVLAGRGSGAAARSEVTATTVAGVDIGGGTSNIALFQNGRLLETACVNLGGKSLRLDPRTARLTQITPVAQQLLAQHGLHLSAGRSLDLVTLRKAAAILAGVLADALVPRSGAPGRNPAHPLPGLYDGPPLSGLPLGEVIISGGVSTHVYAPGPAPGPAPGDQPPDAPRTLAAALAHGDIGPALGWELSPALAARGLRLGPAAETVFATVIGVGVHSLNLSGSTIRIKSPALLPLRNLPVLQPFPGAAPVDASAWASALPQHLRRQEPGAPVAVAVGPLPDLSYDSLGEVARGILVGMDSYLRQGLPLVVVAEQDIASSLGLLLSTAANAVVVDELALRDGDYVDIGKPLYGGTVVPVVVKTLVFAT